MGNMKKFGTRITVDSESDKITKIEPRAGNLLPPKPGVCQDCAVDHTADQPHNQQSLYYQMQFHGLHGRWPTWSDAMEHCTPEVKAIWRSRLIKTMKKNGMRIPEDLLPTEDMS